MTWTRRWTVDEILADPRGYDLAMDAELRAEAAEYVQQRIAADRRPGLLQRLRRWVLRGR